MKNEIRVVGYYLSVDDHPCLEEPEVLDLLSTLGFKVADLGSSLVEITPIEDEDDTNTMTH